MWELGSLVHRLELGNGLAVRVYNDPNAGQWTAQADIPTPIGMVQVSAKARQDVVTAAMRAARELFCRLLGIGCPADASDVFLSGADDAPSNARVAAAKVVDVVSRVARAASLLHRARLGDPAACAGVAHIVQQAKAGHEASKSAWRTMQTLAGLSQIAQSFAPREVADAQYDAMAAGYRARPALNMVAGPDGSYRLERRADGGAATVSGEPWRPHVGASVRTLGGRYGLAMRW